MVVSHDGQKHHAYGHYMGGTVARDDYPDRIVIFQDTLEATSATTRTCCAPRSSAPSATRSPTTWAGTSPACAGSGSESARSLALIG